MVVRSWCSIRPVVVLRRLALLGLSTLQLASFAWSHEAIALQVAGLSRRIEQEPGNATLYLWRGELHRIHRDWAPAIADFARASRLEPGLHAVSLCLARLLSEAEIPTLSLAALDRYLAVRPADPEAALLRGRVLLGLGRCLEAAGELARGIELLREPRAPRPDDYLDRARALAAAGEQHLERAIGGLDEGLARLRGAVPLQLLAIELELRRGRNAAALERLAALAARSPRQEKWLARRGEVLARAGRTDEARRAFEDALAAVEMLPARCRNARATVELAADVRRALAALPPAGGQTESSNAAMEAHHEPQIR